MWLTLCLSYFYQTALLQITTACQSELAHKTKPVGHASLEQQCHVFPDMELTLALDFLKNVLLEQLVATHFKNLKPKNNNYVADNSVIQGSNYKEIVEKEQKLSSQQVWVIVFVFVLAIDILSGRLPVLTHSRGTFLDSTIMPWTSTQQVLSTSALMADTSRWLTKYAYTTLHVELKY